MPGGVNFPGMEDKKKPPRGKHNPKNMATMSLVCVNDVVQYFVLVTNRNFHV